MAARQPRSSRSRPDSSRLALYHSRRDFTRTPEPAGAAGPAAGRRFVVQKHAARRLHFDLRLEWGGVLLSWAVTRGPSADPTARRLAVRTEDHPLDYATFEGTIPAGEYGGGTVMLWDRGTWAPLADVEEGLAEGKLKFTLAGERLKGAWTLVRMPAKPGERAENWLMIKERGDAFAEDDPESLVDRHTTSIASGRAMAEIAEGRPERKQPARRAARGRRPGFVAPQLAVAATDPPDGDAWLHEIKFDGYRALAALGPGGPALYTRSGLDWTGRFAAVVPALAAIACRDALIDGEIIAPGPPGGSFSELQARLSDGGALAFVAFDLLSLDGRDLRRRPLTERKARLEALVADHRGPALHLSTHITGHGRRVLEEVAAAGHEGILSKKADAPYRSGRHPSWLKIKRRNDQEFVVGGYSPSASRGRPFASLLLGTYEGRALAYRGRVGTGFSGDDLADLAARLAPLARATPPFAAVPPETRGAAWVEPRLVVAIRFAELTADGHVRHGVFRGLREDKEPRAVTREPPAEKPARTDPAAPRVRGVAISSHDRAVYPRPKVTKLAVAEYYDAIAPRLLPLAGGRPLSFVRCPDGVEGSCFFQKHRTQGLPRAIGAIEVNAEKEEYVTISGAAGLVAAAQMGVIEFHIWGSRNDDLERPDRLVFDLDPDEGLPFGRVKAAARELRDRLEALGLPSLPMVTGGKGVHVIVPLRPAAGWETVKLTARTIATALAGEQPDRFTARMAKSGRRGKIFIDWLRNDRGATAIAPYSLRARPGAKVAVPVGWDELSRLRRADAFDLKAALARTEPCPLRAARRRGVALGDAVIARLERSLRDGDDGRRRRPAGAGSRPTES